MVDGWRSFVEVEPVALEQPVVVHQLLVVAAPQRLLDVLADVRRHGLMRTHGLVLQQVGTHGDNRIEEGVFDLDFPVAPLG